MYSAIIVDDEEKICKLIQMLGNWEELSIEITGIFCNGEDALEKILTDQPDIVITDIKMPVYDGLELIEKTRDAGIESSFIIISGYRHFEYAYRSMQFGIVDYLLKPVNKDDLNHTLKKVCQNLKLRQEAEHEKSVYQALLREKQVQRNFALLSDLETASIAKNTLAEFNSHYQTSFSFPHFRVLLLNTTLPQLHLSNASFQNHVEDIARQLFSDDCSALALQNFHGIFCLVNYSHSKSLVIHDQISRFFNTLCSLTDIFGVFSLSLGAGGETDNLSQLPQSYQQAVSYVQAKLTLGWDKIISYLPDQLSSCPEHLVGEKELKSLRNCLDLHNIVSIQQWFEDWKSDLSKYPVLNPAALYAARGKILDIITNHFPDIAETDDIIMWTDCAKNLPDFITKLQDFTSSVVAQKLAELNAAEVLPIRQAKEYIAQFYANPITLEEIARHVNYNPAYFSAAFKKHTGQNFSDYLTEFRIDKAKELLRTTQLSVIEISRQVGYNDNKYFRKLFKKVTGIKPSDYKKLY